MKPELDEFHYHEMLDRISLLMSIIDDHLQQHPVGKLESEVKNLIEEAHLKLYEAYQIVGKISYEKFDGFDTRKKKK